jgi:hypothetical protein
MFGEVLGCEKGARAKPINARFGCENLLPPAAVGLLPPLAVPIGDLPLDLRIVDDNPSPGLPVAAGGPADRRIQDRPQDGLIYRSVG